MSVSVADRLLTAEELAERWQVVCKSKKAQTIYRMTREGRLEGAVVRLGPKKYRYRLEGIEAFEAGGGTSPTKGPTE